VLGSKSAPDGLWIADLRQYQYRLYVCVLWLNRFHRKMVLASGGKVAVTISAQIAPKRAVYATDNALRSPGPRDPNQRPQRGSIQRITRPSCRSFVTPTTLQGGLPLAM